MQSSASIQPRTDHPNLGLPVGPTPLRPVRKRRLPGRPASARRARKEPSGPDPPASAAYRRLRKPGRVGGREGLKNNKVSLEPGGRSFSSLPSLLLLPPSFSFFDLFLSFLVSFFPLFQNYQSRRTGYCCGSIVVQSKFWQQLGLRAVSLQGRPRGRKTSGNPIRKPTCAGEALGRATLQELRSAEPAASRGTAPSGHARFPKIGHAPTRRKLRLSN